MPIVGAGRFEPGKAWWTSVFPLYVLGGFTLFSVLGYATFGRRPQILLDYPSLLSFYSISFQFFAQAHVALCAVALAVYLIPRVGFRWAGPFLAVYLVSFTSEFVGTTYGVPFGPYGYNALLGAKWFGRVPLVIPLSWFLMAIPAYAVAVARFGKPALRIGVASLLLAAWDLSLDPAMSYLTSYWWWGEQGPYYSMPLLNLLGWILTGIVIMIVLEAMGAHRWLAALSLRWMAAYYLITLLMPFGMVVAGGLWGAAAATLGALALAWITLRSTFDGRDRGDGLHKAMDTEVTARVSEAGRVGAAPAHAIVGMEPSFDAAAYFAAHSRSFSFAARWFPRPERRMIACLYAYCRTTDDLVDAQVGRPPEAVDTELAAWLGLSRAAYEGKPSGIGWLDEIMQASAKARMPFEIIEDLVQGVRTDLGRVRVQDDAELMVYAYRVASVVGLWMCYLHGVTRPETLEQAAALGRAMQITNILRDVGDDFAQDRIYLPAARMQAHGVAEADLKAMAEGGAPPPGYIALIQGLVRLADAQYAFAAPGLAALPPAFGRAAAVASGVYQGIHGALERNGYDNFRRRAYTTNRAKIRLTARALLALRRAQRAHRPAAEKAVGWLPAGRTLLAALLLVGAAATGSPEAAFGQEARRPAATARDRPDPFLDALRESYLAATRDRDEIARGLQRITRSGRTDPEALGYRAAFEALKAKYAFWPTQKMQHLNAALPALDRLVGRNPRNVEVRYLRLLSCYFLPGFLGRKQTVQEDFSALADILPEARGQYPPTLYRQMAGFVLKHGRLGAAQRDGLAAAAAAPESAASLRPEQ